MSLRWKITLALAVIASVATVAVGAANHRSTRDRLYVEIDRSLTAVDARITERIVDRGGVFLPERGPLAGFDAQVIRLDGSVGASTFASPLPVGESELGVVGQRGRSTYTTVDADDGTYRVRTVGFDRGAFQIGRSLDETERVLQSLRARTVLWTLIVIAAAIAAGWWIASRVTASLRRLTMAAEQVGATGRLDVAVGEDGRDEVGRLGVAFDRMLAALRRSRDEQQRLVQDAGHELRTPLTSLQTNLDALGRYPSMSANDRGAVLADLQAETHELTQLVDEIVMVASGAQSDEPYRAVDLLAVAEEVAGRFSRRTGRRIDVVGEQDLVIGQRASLYRAVSSLVDNACKFDQSDEPIDVHVADHAVVVRDHGPGIAEHDIDRVFDRFHRAESARSLPGSGLGLSIVREIARRHGGEAFAEPAPGGGACVGFRVGVMAPPTA